MTSPSNGPGNGERLKQFAELGLAGVIVLAAVVALWRWSSPGKPDDPLSAVAGKGIRESLAPRLMTGLADAPVALVVVSDFECSYCARFAATILPEIKRTLVDTGRVALYYRHFLVQGHERAPAAARLAECADRRGRFWAAHDALFAATPRLTDALFDNLSSSLGLESWEKGECSRRNAADAVRADHEWARALGVSGTPSFFLGKRGADGMVKFAYAFSGARPAEEFGRMVDLLERRPR